MTDDQLNKAIAEVWKMFEATDQKMEKAILEMREQSRETDRKLAEIGNMVENLTHKWGRFVENILTPGLPEKFRRRGIPITQVHQRSKSRRNGKRMEIDLLCVNEGYVVAVEVKSTLKTANIDDHIEKLAQFKEFFPHYKNCKILGAVAGIEIVEGADVYAEKQGLFVITQSGGIAEILNDSDFEPNVW